MDRPSALSEAARRGVAMRMAPDLVQGIDAKMRKMEFDTLITKENLLGAHKMFAPSGELAPNFLESEF